MARNDGYEMKIFALIILLVFTMTCGIMAQSDNYGDVDTLYFSEASASAGEMVSIQVRLWNDEELGGVTLPLVYPTDKLEFQEVDFTGGRVEHILSKPLTVNEAEGTILVGAIVIFEDYIAVGDGSLFTIKFRLKDDLVPGETITIDSTSLPPAYFVLTHAQGSNILPAFKAGTITVAEKNVAPSFVPIPEIYVAEGESLFVNVQVQDPDGNSVTLANPVHPYNSTFTDNGDGTGLFAWCPEFVGPQSAETSPHTFVFWATDGELSSYLQVKIHVINVNRPPVITAPPTISTEAGDSLGIVVRAIDPDFDAVTLTVEGMPSGADFNFENPGLINWPSQYEDSGAYAVKVIATDTFGLADTADIDITLVPVSFFALRIDTLTTFSGRAIPLNVRLENKEPIKEFEILINLDPTIFTPLTVVFDSYLAQDFGFIEYRMNHNGLQGDLRISGRAMLADAIPAGEGILCQLLVQVSSNLNFVGQQIPVPFVIRTTTNNTVILEDDRVISSDEINMFDGFVNISANGDRHLGDINLNSIAYEIADAVYFSNHYIKPQQFPMDEQQVINSDINLDGNAPSIADLVLLIKIITGATEPPGLKAVAEIPPAHVALDRRSDGVYLTADVATDIGGAYFQFTGPDVDQLDLANFTAMDLQSGQSGDMVNCLLTSFEEKSIASGYTDILKLSDDGNLQISLAGADLADVNGAVIDSYMKSEGVVLPKQFELHQNYPNPFNPSTEIRFDMSAPGRVQLSIYNILGQEVTRLVDGDYPAGQHEVMWNGTDDEGRSVASGIYLYRIQVADYSESRKMVLMK